MGILNLTDDSFYAGSRVQDRAEVICRIETMAEQGADIIDLGWVSTRPGAMAPSEAQELEMVKSWFPWIQSQYPNLKFSIDTFRASVAHLCLDHGAAMINDVSGGRWDIRMYETVASYQASYVLMHSKEMPESMQQDPRYDHLMEEMIWYFSHHIQKARQAGIRDLIIDPGFGFAKTMDHNYELLARLSHLRIFDLPILVGLSRKSMIQKLLHLEASEALNGTTVLHTIALLHGAHILRVHDVREAVQCVNITQKLISNE